MRAASYSNVLSIFEIIVPKSMNFSLTSMPIALMFSTKVVDIAVAFCEPSATMNSNSTRFFCGSRSLPEAS